ncbi:hypothetical protein PYW07_000872 [Mythimna separata]|uniref:peptidylprolyl isomerase n=1 Tax=Mythimna separata TaxID=271217 RepID=A0AAD8DVE4_MYTSE|nr:hypothetical protein PYW07_000872 [Mythimna separata]
MSSKTMSFMLENGLNLREVVTTGSILHINQDYDESDLKLDEKNDDIALNKIDILGQPVPNFAGLAEKLVAIDDTGFVKKKIIEEGGGLPLHEGCTVSIAFSGYWENEQEPFDVVRLKKPMEVDLKENGLLPGLQMAVKSMLVGEIAVFLLSYKVMYGEMGVPPRIKPKADCVFYIKVTKTILTPKEGKINFSEPNMFERVNHEVKLLYSSGSTLYNTKNYVAAIQCFKKAVNMLHRCRLANEEEEATQEKLLIKLYINLVVCYNKVNKPLLACSACNELNRLRSLWNNPKALFQNAKALRIIGGYDEAQKRLKRAMKLKPDNEEMEAEYKLLMKTWAASRETKQNAETVKEAAIGLISEKFKREVDDLVKNFKMNDDEDQLIIPSYFNSHEIAYFKEVCVRENLFFTKDDQVYPKKCEDVLPDEEASQAGEEQSESDRDLYISKT